MARNDPAIAIIGGGIGGLAAAQSLVKAGFDAHVYEQAPELREVGAGIVMSPNATRRAGATGTRRPDGERCRLLVGQAERMELRPRRGGDLREAACEALCHTPAS